ncbi:MAG: hypothetical protein FWC42_10210 [Proteobacteria bacterium]|nr:hypothetical protein [Pseudomonadota bacterium]
MYYWNKDNFEGLLELAHELRKTPELGRLAEYCVLREKGLRSQALARLNDFLAEAALWDTGLARRNVLTILEAGARTSEAHPFMAHPLLARLIYPTLDQWMVDEPSAVEPLRWFGLLQSDADALRRALSLSPDDIPVRRRLIHFAIDYADFATHHLSESVLLSSVEEVRAAIATARQYIASAPDIKPFAGLSVEANEYEQMVDDWEAYNQSPTGTFPQWCKTKGRAYSWPAVIYYDDDAVQQHATTDTTEQRD